MKWEKPTVKAVETLMIEAAQVLNTDDYRRVHAAIGVSDRTFRRWKSNADIEPQNLSNIPFRAWLQLKTIADRSCPLAPIEGADWTKIPPPYVTSAKEFIPIPSEVLKEIIGLNAMMKTSRKEIARTIGVNSKRFSEDMDSGNISFATWSLILLLCDTPWQKIFKL